MVVNVKQERTWPNATGEYILPYVYSPTLSNEKGFQVYKLDRLHRRYNSFLFRSSTNPWTVRNLLINQRKILVSIIRIANMRLISSRYLNVGI